MIFDPLLHGEGFEGFRTAIDIITEDLWGGGPVPPPEPGTAAHYETQKAHRYLRAAVSKEFEDDVREHVRRRLPRDEYRVPEWTAYTDRDFNTTAWRVANRLASKPAGLVLATAPAPHGGGVLELREDRCDLAGANYRLYIAGVIESSKYDSRARKNKPAWSPYVTDEAVTLINGSAYSSTPRNVNVQSQAAAYESMKRLVERHFKVAFTNVDPSVLAA